VDARQGKNPTFKPGYFQAVKPKRGFQGFKALERKGGFGGLWRPLFGLFGETLLDWD